jgi:hypothetical protein
MTQTQTTSIVESTIRAGVDVKAFLANMEFAFTSNSTYLGELMQNSRRAGATKVEFTYDTVTKSLTIDDDGVGVLDFESLVVNSRSGWDESIQDSESPFGMGFYSVFFACDEVVVESLGGRMTATKDQIVNCEDLHVVRADTADRGTRIIMRGLRGGPEHEISRLAIGFGIPVHLNGNEISRSLAPENLKMQACDIGLVHIPGIHNERQLPSDAHHRVRLFLQGLPIHQGWASETVVHLDSKQFKARMPDRTTLYDEAAALDRVTVCVLKIVRQFLTEQRLIMKPEEFVERYWKSCQHYDVLHLLDDLEFIPRDCVLRASMIHYDGSLYPATSLLGRGSAVISRDELVSLKRILVLDPPSAVRDEEDAAQLLSAMRLLDMLGFDTYRTVSANHWIHSIGIPASDLRVSHEAINGTDDADAPSVWICDSQVKVHLAGTLNILVVHVANDEVLASAQGLGGFYLEKAQGEGDSLFRVWIASKENYPELVNAFTDFCDENEVYMEAWDNDAARQWSAKVNKLRGEPLHEIVRSAINHDDSIIVRDNMRGQLCLVRTEHDASRLNVVDLSQAIFWASLASQLNGRDLTAQALQDAFNGALSQPTCNDAVLAV